MQTHPMITSTTDLVFVLFIATAAIFYSSRHFLRKGQIPEFLEQLLEHHTQKMALIILFLVGALVIFGLVSVFYAISGNDVPN